MPELEDRIRGIEAELAALRQDMETQGEEFHILNDKERLFPQYYPAMFWGYGGFTFTSGSADTYDIEWDLVTPGASPAAHTAYVADTPFYTHSVTSDPDLIKLAVPGRYLLDIDAAIHITIGASQADLIWESFSVAPFSPNSAPFTDLWDLGGGGNLWLGWPFKHELAHDHGGAVASDLGDFKHEPPFEENELYDSCHISFWFDLADCQPDYQLKVRVTRLDSSQKTYNVGFTSRLRLIYLGGGKQ